jgi:hypothetical protein
MEWPPNLAQVNDGHHSKLAGGGNDEQRAQQRGGGALQGRASVYPADATSEQVYLVCNPGEDA